MQLKVTSFKKISKVDLILETVDLFLSIQITSLSVMRYYQQIHGRNNRTLAIEELLIFDQDEEKSSSLELNKIQTKKDPKGGRAKPNMLYKGAHPAQIRFFSSSIKK